MFCNQCGSSLPNGIAYCTHCGKAVGTPAAPAPAAMAGVPAGSAQGRVARHRNLLGILWLVRAGMLMLPGMFMVGFSGVHRWPMDGMWGGMSSMRGPFPAFLGPLLGGIGFLLLTLAVLDLIAGLGLLMLQSWARILAIVVGVIELVSFPLGTALGIFTLWVLLPNDAEREYLQMAQARVGH